MEVKCPTCGRAVVWEDQPIGPFCSERCQLLDFGAWADEEFRVPVEGADWSEDEISDAGSTNGVDGDHLAERGH
jgi:endogenous inhibitor of DNA gyrase (YacG/DUF329 family)